MKKIMKLLLISASKVNDEVHDISGDIKEMLHSFSFIGGDK